MTDDEKKAWVRKFDGITLYEMGEDGAYTRNADYQFSRDNRKIFLMTFTGPPGARKKAETTPFYYELLSNGNLVVHKDPGRDDKGSTYSNEYEFRRAPNGDGEYKEETDFDQIKLGDYPWNDGKVYLH